MRCCSRFVSVVTAVAIVAGWAFPRLAEAQPNPQKIVAVLDATRNFGTTQRSINFYDITDLSGGSVFNQTPLFSVWMGYEDTANANQEDITSIAINPVNGTVYVAASDDTGNIPDDASIPTEDMGGRLGETLEDFDLYRIDYQYILNEFVSNGRAAGTMYGPAMSVDGLPNIDHPSHLGTTVFLSNGIGKVGEVARTAGGPNGHEFDMEFIRPDALVMLDNETSDLDLPEFDHELRVWRRTDTAAGTATYNAGTNQGGYNAQTSQSWESTGTLLNMDGQTGASEPEAIAFVRRDGVIGVWVEDNDQPANGDDVGFFELDLTTNTATPRELRVGTGEFFTSFALDDDPVVDPTLNDGSHDWLNVAANGDLVIGESGFFDTPQHEPKVIGREIVDYGGGDTGGNPDGSMNGVNEVVPGGWTTSADMPVPANDDDTNITDGRFVAYDKGTGYVWYFDIDSGSVPAVIADVYVFDPVTGNLVYQEEDAANHFVEQHGLRIFLRGDVTNDGLVTAADIDGLYAAVGDPTLGGQVSAGVGAEWHDLTADGSLTGVPNDGGDVDELVRNILGTDYGDADLNGSVTASGDGSLLLSNLGGASGWAGGDFDGSGTVTASGDGALLLSGLGTDAAAAVPEPGTLWLVVVLLGAVGISRQWSQH